MSFIIRPVTLRQANAFVLEHHRHADPSAGGLWAIALLQNDQLVGVAIAGRPVNRVLQARGYMEIIRVCVLDGHLGACSMLYTRCRRIGQLMGYERFVSYNLPSESGSSLLAAGFRPICDVKGRQWNTPSRPRRVKHAQDRVRWEAVA